MKNSGMLSPARAANRSAYRPACKIINKIDVLKKGDVRRAKLYYLREKKGKKAKRPGFYGEIDVLQLFIGSESLCVPSIPPVSGF